MKPVTKLDYLLFRVQLTEIDAPQYVAAHGVSHAQEILDFVFPNGGMISNLEHLGSVIVPGFQGSDGVRMLNFDNGVEVRNWIEGAQQLSK
jgi:hypothetical protein